MKPRSLDGKNLADRQPESIRPVLSSLRKDTDQRPILPSAWMASATFDLFPWHFVKKEDHLNMTKSAESRESFETKTRRIELDSDAGMAQTAKLFVGQKMNRRATGIVALQCTCHSAGMDRSLLTNAKRLPINNIVYISPAPGLPNETRNKYED